MDKAKNFFDAWVNTQAKIVDGLVETSKKMQETFGQSEVVEKTASIYREWANKQKDLTENLVAQFQDEKANTSYIQEQSYQLAKKWVEEQIKVGTNLLAMLQNSPVQNQTSTNFYEEWQKMQQQSLQNMMQPFAFMPNAPYNQNTLAGFINNTRTYMQMFELWQSLFKLMQTGEAWIENISKFVDASQYQDIVRDMFQLKKPENLMDTFEQLQKYLQNMSKNWSIPASANWDWKQNPFQNLEQLATLNTNFSEQFYKTINPYFTMTPPSQEKKMAELSAHLQEKYIKYYLKSIELQQHILYVSQKSLEKTLKHLADKYTQTQQLPTFDDFYNFWVNTSEQDLIQLFSQESFAKIQADMVKLGLAVKVNLDQQLETLLAPLPFVPRSEIDELNATIYELKNKVRQLEKTLQDSYAKEKDTPTNAKQAQEIAPQATAKVKKTTTRKPKAPVDNN